MKDQHVSSRFTVKQVNRAHPGQALASARKQLRQEQREAVLAAEALLLGISVTELRFKKAREYQEIIASASEAARQRAAEAQREYDRRWGRYHY